MIEFDNIKAVLAKYEEPLKNMAGSLDLDNKKDRAEELDKTMINDGILHHENIKEELKNIINDA